MRLSSTRETSSLSDVHNHFTASLTRGNEAIRGDRARVACSAAERAQRKIIDGIKDKLDKLIIERENLSDLNPRNTTSLVFAGGNFDGEVWAHRMNSIELDLVNLEVELQVAENTYDKWFAPIEKPTPKAAAKKITPKAE